MKSEVLKKVIILAFLAVNLGACTQGSGNGNLKVAIPVDDGHNNYTLQSRELHTVNDIYSMAGTAAVIKADGHFDIDVDASNHSFVENGFEFGTTPSAHFVKVDDVFHATDFMTLAMSAAMYHFENIKTFYDQIGATAGMTFPRPVMFNIKVTTHVSNQWVEAVNNAAFLPAFDAFWIDPYEDIHIPLSFNGGVLGHEYLHNVFNNIMLEAAERHKNDGSINMKQYQDIVKLTQGVRSVNEWAVDPNGQSGSVPGDMGTSAQPPLPDVAAARTSGAQASSAPFASPSPGPIASPDFSPDDLKIANKFLFDSVNEGLADFFGYEYSNNAAWIIASIPSQTFRVLSEPRQFLSSPENQERRFIESTKTKDPHLMIDVHGIGSFYAHFLWTVANDPSWGHDAAKRAALDFMKNYAEFLTTSRDKKYMSMGNLVQLFFKTRAPGPDLCRAVQSQFYAELNNYNCGLFDQQPEQVQERWQQQQQQLQTGTPPTPAPASAPGNALPSPSPIANPPSSPGFVPPILGVAS